VIRIGDTYRVPTAGLLELLGVSAEEPRTVAEAGRAGLRRVGQPIRRMASSIRFQKPSKSSVVATSAFGLCPKRLPKSTEVMPLVWYAGSQKAGQVLAAFHKNRPVSAG
jgi:hypothetical protein